MEFRATQDVNVDVQVEHRCGDNCCSWYENESEPLRKGDTYEPEFEYGNFMTHEGCFWLLVRDGYFEPADDEAQAWFEDNFATFNMN